MSFALGPDGQQARGTVSDNQGTTAHCDIAQIVAVQPSQPTFSSAATTSTASNPRTCACACACVGTGVGVFLFPSLSLDVEA